jgi:hypothetical protein
MAFAAHNEGRREGGPGGDTLREPDGFVHLDADELSAYAENALPARTRARYTEHLADCDSCRTLVTQLVLSSGIAAQLEKEAAPPVSTVPARSWRDWLATIFAPTRLRYAASVLAVVGIAAIAFMVFRGGRPVRFETGESQSSRSENVNDTGQNASAPALEKQSDAGSKVNSNSAPIASVEPSKPDGVVSGTLSQPKEGEQQAPATELQKSADTKGPVENPAPATAPNDDLVGQNRVLRDQDAEADKNAQPATPPPAVDRGKAKKEIDGADSSEETARLSASRERINPSKSATAQENKPQFGKTEESAGNRKARRVESSTPKDAPASSVGAGSGASAGATMDERNEREDRAGRSEEKRSVSGKQFLRRGGAWVDTAYRSQATTNVRRGSEQYRSLVADEPELRDIANQLGGEIIVVIKGRAYRIR